MEKYYLLFRKYWLDFFIYFYIFFIVYTTIVPFNFIDSVSALQVNISKIDWIPFMGGYRVVSRSDIIANVLFFMPLGILLALKKILTYYRRFSSSDWLQIFFSGFFISLLVELMQLFTYDRHTSVTDVVTNSMGTLLGAFSLLVIYLKFHDQIKRILFHLFAFKPEMTVSAIFLGFILISFSVPFTFQPDLVSLRENFRILINKPFSISQFFAGLPVSLILFGTFAYFLMNGIFRYLKRELSTMQVVSIIVTLILLPFLLEFYQVLIPIRNHSLSDIVAAESGIWGGLIFFTGQTLTGQTFKQNKQDTDRIFFGYYMTFLKFLIWVYIAYFVTYFIYGDTLRSFLETIRDLFIRDSARQLALVKIRRMELLIHLAKEVFTFLPAGFVLSLTRFRLRQYFDKVLFISSLIILVLLGAYLVNVMKYSFNGFIVLHLLAMIWGLAAGHFFRKIFIFIMNTR
jgi:glycopeptide antibiotics resistance protein